MINIIIMHVCILISEYVLFAQTRYIIAFENENIFDNFPF